MPVSMDANIITLLGFPATAHNACLASLEIHTEDTVASIIISIIAIYATREVHVLYV